MRSRAFLSTLVLALAVLAAVPLRAQLTPVAVDLGGNGLGLALRRLGVTGRVLSSPPIPTTSTTACWCASPEAWVSGPPSSP